jgi:hypothetical protein
MKKKVQVAGEEITLPTVTTDDVYDESSPLSTATGEGTIVSTGGENCDKRGFVYSVAIHGAPGNVAPSASGYESNVEAAGSFEAEVFKTGMINLNLQPPASYTEEAFWEGDDYTPATNDKMKVRVYTYWVSCDTVYSATYKESNEIGSTENYWNGVFTWTVVADVTGYKVYQHDSIYDVWGKGIMQTAKSIIIFDYTDTPVAAPTPLAGTTYYCRAYAHNSAGYTYGDEISFP